MAQRINRVYNIDYFRNTMAAFGHEAGDVCVCDDVISFVIDKSDVISREDLRWIDIPITRLPPKTFDLLNGIQQFGNNIGYYGFYNKNNELFGFGTLDEEKEILESIPTASSKRITNYYAAISFYGKF